MLLGFVMVGCLGAPRYRGPPSANFDGAEFRNLAPFEQRDVCDVLKWKLSGDAQSEALPFIGARSICPTRAMTNRLSSWSAP